MNVRAPDGSSANDDWSLSDDEREDTARRARSGDILDQRGAGRVSLDADHADIGDDDDDYEAV